MIKCGIKLLIHSQIPMAAPLKFGNTWIISSQRLLGMWLLIHVLSKLIHVTESDSWVQYHRINCIQNNPIQVAYDWNHRRSSRFISKARSRAMTAGYWTVRSRYRYMDNLNQWAYHTYPFCVIYHRRDRIVIGKKVRLYPSIKQV